jgi:hypothetical protein
VTFRRAPVDLSVTERRYRAVLEFQTRVLELTKSSTPGGRAVVTLSCRSGSPAIGSAGASVGTGTGPLATAPALENLLPDPRWLTILARMDL